MHKEEKKKDAQSSYGNSQWLIFNLWRSKQETVPMVQRQIKKQKKQNSAMPENESKVWLLFVCYCYTCIQIDTIAYIRPQSVKMYLRNMLYNTLDALLYICMHMNEWKKTWPNPLDLEQNVNNRHQGPAYYRQPPWDD